MRKIKKILLYIFALFICPKETACAVNEAESIDDFEKRILHIATT